MKSDSSRSSPRIDWQSLAIRQGANLPHWTCNDAIYHVVFRLADAVPAAVLKEWRIEREQIINTAAALGRELSESERQRLDYLYSEKIKSYLDAGHGQCWLRQPELAEMMVNTLHFFNGQHYRLHAGCVMPSHVHVVVEPLSGWTLSRIAHGWKSYSAHRANRQLGRHGAFWQHEIYDRIIRSAREYRIQVEYVRGNPEQARLTNWRWVF